MTDETATEHPKRWKWRLEWLAVTGLEKLAGLLPGALVFRAGESLGGLAWHLLPQRRNIVLRNLRIAFHGEHGLPELRRMARENFRRTGGNLLSAVHTARLPATGIDSVLRVENQDLIEHAMSGSAGLVLMPAHMGNWEILSRMNRLFPQGHGIGAFYRPLSNPLLDARVVAQRATDGTRVFSKWDSLMQVAAFLRKGALVGILADQRIGKQGELLRFFGRLTRASPLPSLMARRAKAEVLTMSLVSSTPGKWDVRYHPVARPFTTAHCMEALERAMKASPLDVFWFHERWRVYVRRSSSIRDWLGPDSLGSGKPHRALLWLDGVPEAWEIPAEWVHADVIYEIVLAPNQPTPRWLTGSEILHTAPRESLRKSLRRIDAAAALPVDFILTCGGPVGLKRAATAETIPFVSLASAARKPSESPELTP